MNILVLRATARLLTSASVLTVNRLFAWKCDEALLTRTIISSVLNFQVASTIDDKKKTVCLESMGTLCQTKPYKILWRGVHVTAVSSKILCTAQFVTAALRGENVQKQGWSFLQRRRPNILNCAFYAWIHFIVPIKSRWVAAAGDLEVVWIPLAH